MAQCLFKMGQITKITYNISPLTKVYCTVILYVQNINLIPYVYHSTFIFTVLLSISHFHITKYVQTNKTTETTIYVFIFKKIDIFWWKPNFQIKMFYTVLLWWTLSLVYWYFIKPEYLSEIVLKFFNSRDNTKNSYRSKYF